MENVCEPNESQFGFGLFVGAAFAGATFLLDDLEGPLVQGDTVDAGAGNGSRVAIVADTQEKHSGAQSIRVDYDAVSGGYIWVARGYGLDVKGAAQWSTPPQDIDWSRYGALSFYYKGDGAGARIAVDIKDAGGEMLRFMVTDDSKQWKQVICSFDAFFPRGDGQPPNAATNGALDFPIKSFQFEPIAVAKGTLFIDEVDLEPLN